MSAAKPLFRTQITLAVFFFLSLPGFYYFFPTDPSWKLLIPLALAALWLIRSLIPKAGPGPYRKAQWMAGALLTLFTYLFLTIPLHYLFGVLLTFFRILTIVAVAVGVGYVASTVKKIRELPIRMLPAIVGILLTSMIAGWWNWNMIGSRSYQSSDTQPEVRSLLLVEDLKKQAGAGECHPYDIAYHTPTNSVVASFKDDWGAVFPRLDHEKKHNLVAVCNAGAGPPNVRTLDFGPNAVPEDIALHPSLPIGWVNLLNYREQKLCLAAFAYDHEQIRLLKQVELSGEPNGLIYDPVRDRLIVLGMDTVLLDIDPVTLEERNRIELNPNPHGFIPLGPAYPDDQVPLDSPLSSDMLLVSGDYDAEKNRIYLGTVGLFIHALNLDDMSQVRKRTFPVVMSLTRFASRNELLVALPFLHTVWILDADSLAQKQSIGVGTSVRPVAGIDGTEWLVVGSYSENLTMIIDRISGKVLRKYRLGRLGRAAAIDPESRRVFFATGLGLFEIDADKVPGANQGHSAEASSFGAGGSTEAK